MCSFSLPSALKRRSWNRMRGIGRAARHLVEARRAELIGVDVGLVDRRGDRGEVVKGVMDSLSSAAGRGGAQGRRFVCRPPAYHPPSAPRSSRTSVSLPLIAAAAAIAGLTRCVRPPVPWRPRKLRLDVEAQRSPGLQLIAVDRGAQRAARFAPFEARSRNIVSRPSLLRLTLDRCASPARSTRAPRPCPSFATCAAARDPRAGCWCTNR
jgi:hypothetical protein